MTTLVFKKNRFLITRRHPPRVQAQAAITMTAVIGRHAQQKDDEIMPAGRGTATMRPDCNMALTSNDEGLWLDIGSDI